MSAKKIVKIVTENIRKLVSEQLPSLIEDAVDEVIHEKVDDELSQTTSEEMSKILEFIHKKHAVPLDLLLRDAEEARNTNICKGIVKESNGETRRCSFRGKFDGYCKFHKDQGERIQKRVLHSGDHFKSACNEVREAQSELRDLGIL